ncbi:MAG TPA: DUF1835 domain-containing protein [Candidatus Rubrimentiphilum sp.]|nr:DUF1835 domain-containing protein [Candidatus Rubrimentiphilum sp.]
MSTNSLHITNGDSVLYTWKKGGLLGTHLAWRDVLHEGPVAPNLALEELSRIRAQYLCDRGYGNPIKIHHDFEKRDATLRRAREFDEVVLWFEHDLYDQLHILQILSTLQEMGMGTGSVQLVQSDQYLGTLVAEELMALSKKRRFVTAATTESAVRAWRAFTSPDPAALRDAANQQFAGLPYLHEALMRLCEEYPAADSGLSRSQKQVLEAAAQGVAAQEELFKRSQAREEAPFMGDSACYGIVADLCEQPAPLLAKLENGYDITVLGRRVLGGDADWLEQQPLNRWIGGVHLTSEQHWRWDDIVNSFVARQSTEMTRSGDDGA